MFAFEDPAHVAAGRDWFELRSMDDTPSEPGFAKAPMIPNSMQIPSRTAHPMPKDFMVEDELLGTGCGAQSGNASGRIPDVANNCSAWLASSIRMNVIAT